MPNKRSDRVVLEANTDYWDPGRFPRLQRIVFDNTLSQKDPLELVKTAEGQVDLVTGLRPLETLRVAQSPFASVVKDRGALVTVFGQLNIRKAGSPWRDVRLRQAINLAVNRRELLRDIKGHGVIIPALAPEGAFGYDAALTPYPFDPDRARQILQEAGYPDGLMLELIAPEELQTQAISISMMLEQAGFTMDLQVLDAGAFQRQTRLKDVDHPPEQRTWDVALRSALDHLHFPPFLLYHDFALDGPSDWLGEKPELQRLYEEILRTDAAQPATHIASPFVDRPGVETSSDRIVLAIDDDPDVIYLLRENPVEAGYRVVGAASGEEGLRLTRTLQPSAITLDILMPHIDGWQIDREAILATLARISPHQGCLLVVDDDPQGVDLVRQILEDEPYEVVAATDGQAALEAIAQKRPDVVLLDLLMPEMDGFTVLEQLQQDPETRHLPVIVLTAKTLTAAEHAMLEQRARKVLQKRGLDRDTLLQELRSLLQAYPGPTPKG